MATPAGDIEVRIAAPADAGALVVLLAQLHARYPGDAEHAAAVVRDAADQPGRALLVATAAERLLGTADLLIVSNVTHGGRPWAVVENVVVDEAARGTGVGRALMDAALARVREAGCYMVQLVSLKHRHDAHAFYERLGFAAVAEGLRVYLPGYAPS